MPNKQRSIIKTSYSTSLILNCLISMCPGKCHHCKKLRHILLNLELNYSVKIYPKFINLYTFGKEILWSFQIRYKKIHYVTHIVTWKHNVKDDSRKKKTLFTCLFSNHPCLELSYKHFTPQIKKYLILSSLCIKYKSPTIKTTAMR